MKKKNSGKELLQKLGTLMALALLVLIFCVMMPDKFPRISNIMNIFKQASINCLIASGMLCALITAGIDLSVGSNCVLCTCTIGVLVQNFGITSMPLLIIAGLAVSTFAGFVNGILLTRLDLPHPFVSTLGMKNVLWGLALVITGSKSIAFTNTGVDNLMWIGGGSLFKTETFPGIPFSFILVLIVFGIFHVFLTRSALGRQIYCVGGNPEAARLSGIPSKNVLTFVYSLSGFMAGMAGGVVYAGYLAGTAQITAAGALALSLGIAIQNFPEGAIISMPLRAEGMPKRRAFWDGVLSGIVEPIGAVLTIIASQLIIAALPYLLSFAAGAMLYVVVEELMPELSQGKHSNLGTVFFAIGFSLMMVLDVALG